LADQQIEYFSNRFGSDSPGMFVQFLGLPPRPIAAADPFLEGKPQVTAGHEQADPVCVLLRKGGLENGPGEDLFQAR
jgi:hypothetical protein